MSIDFQSSKKYEMDRDTPFSSCLLCLFVQKKEKIGGGYRSSIKVKNFFSRRLWSRVTFISFDFFYRFLLRELTHALDLRIVCSTTKQGKQRWCCYFCQEKRERRAPFSENNLYAQLCVNSWSYQSPSINIWRTHFWYRKVVFWKRKRRKWNSHHYILFARLHSSWKMIEFSYLIKHVASPPPTWWCKAIDLLERGGCF